MREIFSEAIKYPGYYIHYHTLKTQNTILRTWFTDFEIPEIYFYHELSKRTEDTFRAYFGTYTHPKIGGTLEYLQSRGTCFVQTVTTSYLILTLILKY